jgi:hypothetical protein
MIMARMKSGWFNQKLRHSNAKRFGRAGGKYAGTRFDTMRREEALIGGLADNKPDNAFNKKSLLQGMRVEREHTNKPSVAKEIAKDHLSEDAEYYKKLKTIETPKDEKYNGWTNWDTWAINLYATNDSTTYQQIHRPWVLNFATKMKRGTYNRDEALKAIKKYYIPKALKEAKKYDEKIDKSKIDASDILQSVEEEAKYEYEAQLKKTK